MSFQEMSPRYPQEPQAIPLQDMTLRSRYYRRHYSPDRRVPPHSSNRFHHDDKREDVEKTKLRETKTKIPSTFSILNDDILEFQKMVRKLEAIVGNSGVGPQEQWKARILLGSTEQLCDDIENKLKRQDMDLKRMAPYMAARHKSAQAKLYRDYHRIQASFESLRSDYQQRQRAEVQQLDFNTSSHEQQQELYDWMNDDDRTMHSVLQREEEYSERIMRERERELSAINEKSKQVGEIYQDLGRVVESQQEQVDRVENLLDQAHHDAFAGLEELEAANGKHNLLANSSTEDDMSQTQELLELERNLNWRTPFETMEEDLLSVRRDLEELGDDIIKHGSDKISQASRLFFQCAAFADVSDAELFEKMY